MTQEPSQIAEAKRSLRKQCAARRESIAPDARVFAATAIAATGIGFCGAATGATVSAYSAMGAELDPLPLLERLAREGLRTCLPVVQPLGQPLVFRAWSPGDPLVARTWGIREPGEGARTVEPDMLLVPLLAFDRRGVRLGYGGGYFDRTLERLRSFKPVIAIGLAYASQELPEVPCGPHDQRLDWILTEDGATRI